jgi:hypothetical protein
VPLPWLDATMRAWLVAVSPVVGLELLLHPAAVAPAPRRRAKSIVE